MFGAVVSLLVWILAAQGASWHYFRRYPIKRAPIGVFNLIDVTYMMVAIIVIPFLYLALPGWAMTLLLALETFALVYIVSEPLFGRKLPAALLALLLVAADLLAAAFAGTSSMIFFAVNNLLLLAIIVGATNLLAQSGLKARDAAILGTFLIVYDYIATAGTPVMVTMMNKLVDMPFSFLFLWPGDQAGWWVGLGMGDTMMAAVFPLVMRKAYGRSAGLVALVLGLACVASAYVLPWGFEYLPLMIVMGPLMVAQYLYWRLRMGTERTTQQYLQAEPV